LARWRRRGRAGCPGRVPGGWSRLPKDEGGRNERSRPVSGGRGAAFMLTMMDVMILKGPPNKRIPSTPLRHATTRGAEVSHHTHVLPPPQTEPTNPVRDLLPARAQKGSTMGQFRFHSVWCVVPFKISHHPGGP
jgi:hypothetical protein